MKFFTLIGIFALCLSANAQDVNFNGNTYKIKGKAILQDGTDVTNTLSIEDKTAVFEVLNTQKALEMEKIAKEKEQKAKEKERKNLEKAAKNAEKEQKKAENVLKAKEKAKANYEKANDKHNKAVSKYENLKIRGKLSPNDEAKHLKNIQKLKQGIQKARKKL